MSVAKPQLYVNCLEVIQELAQHPDSAPSLINLLRSDSYGMLFDLLPDIGDAADVLNLPQGAVGYWVVVQSQACLVDILTRVLLVLQPGMEDKDWAVCVEMLKRLLGLTEETGEFIDHRILPEVDLKTLWWMADCHGVVLKTSPYQLTLPLRVFIVM